MASKWNKSTARSSVCLSALWCCSRLHIHTPAFAQCTRGLERERERFVMFCTGRVVVCRRYKKEAIICMKAIFHAVKARHMPKAGMECFLCSKSMPCHASPNLSALLSLSLSHVAPCLLSATLFTHTHHLPAHCQRHVSSQNAHCSSFITGHATIITAAVILFHAMPAFSLHTEFTDIGC